MRSSQTAAVTIFVCLWTTGVLASGNSQTHEAAQSPTAPVGPAETLKSKSPADPKAEPLANAAKADASAAGPEQKPVTKKVQPVSLVAKINLTKQTATIEVDGKEAHVWKISSGTQDFPTPTGNFKADWMAKMWYSKTYDDAPMPHAVFFKDGAAIHATQSTRLLGRPASHGCVRLAPANAETFYKLVQKHGLAATRITVFGQPNYPVAVAKAPGANRPVGEDVPKYRPSRYGYGYGGSQVAAPSSGLFAPSSQLVWPGDRPTLSRYGVR